jgi:hypothetical protein
VHPAQRGAIIGVAFSCLLLLAKQKKEVGRRDELPASPHDSAISTFHQLSTRRTIASF